MKISKQECINYKQKKHKNPSIQLDLRFQRYCILMMHVCVYRERQDIYAKTYFSTKAATIDLTYLIKTGWLIWERNQQSVFKS